MTTQPEGRKRAKPGTKGEGDYFRIVVRSKEEFATFRYHDVGEKGHILRLAGKRSSGSWDTQTWLISKDDAHIEGDTLVADTDDARRLIEALAVCRRNRFDCRQSGQCARKWTVWQGSPALMSC